MILGVKATSPYNFVWQVPITFKSIKDDTKGTLLLKEKSAVLPIPKGTIMNYDHALFYRVNYGDTERSYINNILTSNKSQLSVSDRTGLISDAFSLVAAGHQELTDALAMSKYIKVSASYYL